MKQRLQRIERVAIDQVQNSKFYFFLISQKYSQGDDRFVAGLHANYTAVNLPIGTLNRAANTFTFWDTINQKARFFEIETLLYELNANPQAPRNNLLTISISEMIYLGK